MGTKKPKKLKAPRETGPALGPRPADLPVAAIPDFDDAALLRSFNEFDAVARALMRHLASIQATGDEARKNSLIRTLMLIRLFQQTARSSVGECLVRPFLGLFASFSFSSPAKRPAKSTWPRAAGPKATSAPDARTIAVTRWWDEDAGSAPPVVTRSP